MTAALGTLTFLATLWLIVVVGAAVLEESGARIVAALWGEQPDRTARIALRIRTRARIIQPMRAQAEWRDAA
ncbi:MAG: hypothetical protein ABIW33_05675 [Sphingomicrobium sp.]